MAEQHCRMCTHPRRSHSIQGCMARDRVGDPSKPGSFIDCPCTVKFVEKDNFK